MERKNLSMGILYSLISLIMGSSLVEADPPTPQQCESACAAVCAILVPPIPAQLSTALANDLSVLNKAFVQNQHLHDDVDFIAIGLQNDPQSLYSTIIAPPEIVDLCGTTLGQTNCATVCAPQKKAPPQVGAPAPKAPPPKK